jgi:glutamate-1-semialdehyde 2,1-aminomutase
MFCIFFRDKPPINYTEAMQGDAARYGRFFHSMLKRGVYLAPSAFETAFLSTAHSYEDIDKTVAAFREALRETA